MFSRNENKECPKGTTVLLLLFLQVKYFMHLDESPFNDR